MHIQRGAAQEEYRFWRSAAIRERCGDGFCICFEVILSAISDSIRYHRGFGDNVRRMWGNCEKIVRRLWGIWEEIVRRIWGKCEEIVRKVGGNCEENVRRMWEKSEGNLRRMWGKYRSIDTMTIMNGNQMKRIAKMISNIWAEKHAAHLFEEKPEMGVGVAKKNRFCWIMNDQKTGLGIRLTFSFLSTVTCIKTCATASRVFVMQWNRQTELIYSNTFVQWISQVNKWLQMLSARLSTEQWIPIINDNISLGISQFFSFFVSFSLFFLHFDITNPHQPIWFIFIVRIKRWSLSFRWQWRWSGTI